MQSNDTSAAPITYSVSTVLTVQVLQQSSAMLANSCYYLDFGGSEWLTWRQDKSRSVHGSMTSSKLDPWLWSAWPQSTYCRRLPGYIISCVKTARHGVTSGHKPTFTQKTSLGVITAIIWPLDVRFLRCRGPVTRLWVWVTMRRPMQLHRSVDVINLASGP